MARSVIDLSERRARDARLAGGKAARLSILQRRGLPVPPGFVVTTGVFKELCGRVAGFPPDGDAASPSDLRRRIESISFDPRLETDLRRAMRRIGWPVAVRSSMRGEDAADHSYAGQLDSYLDVRDADALLDAIKRCWAALAGDRFVRYRRERDRGREETCGEMAVLVQRMVPASAAGVAFGCDPHTGRRCVLIEAVPGFGEKLAGGRAEPDRYIVDGRGSIESRRYAHEGLPVLDARRILELALLVEAAGQVMDAPQDVEWAWDGDAFHLLQSRPITSIAGRDVFSSRLVSDMIPGLVKPLVWSTSVLDMTKNVFGRLVADLTGRSDCDCQGLVRLVHSRVYANMTRFGELLRSLGMPANAMEMMARGDRPAVRGRRVSMLKMAPRLLRFLLRHGRVRRNALRFAEGHERDLAGIEPAGGSDAGPAELVDAARRLRSLHGETQWFMWLTAMNMALRHKALARFVRCWAPGVDASGLLRRRADPWSIEPDEEMRRIAERLRELDEAAMREIAGGDDAAIRRRLASTAAGRRVVSSFDTLVARFGHLSVNATDFSRPPWAETPEVIWRGIARLAEAGAMPGSQATRRDREASKVRKRIGSIGRPIFDRLLDSTERYIALRDRVGFLMSEDSWRMRRICLALGERFAGEGVLAERDDVFMLEFDELAELAAGRLPVDRARRLVGERHAAMAADAELEPPEVFCGDEPPVAPAVDEGATTLVGIPASAGVARGIARVVTDPIEVGGKLTREDILVVPFTDPGWTPLFPGIGGIVAETGGQLSHSAIIAREYGVPAVVSVRRATSLIPDGCRIVVDGHEGRVYIE